MLLFRHFIIDMETSLVYANGAIALTNSILVAKKFDRNHRDVLDSIRELIKGCAENSADPMFEETSYIHPQNGQEYPMFIMNRDGFTLLAMGFTGDKALRFKLDYIKAFNAMEEALKKPKPLTKSQQTLEAVKQLCEIAQQQVELEQRQIEMESEQKLLAQKVSNIEDVIKPNGFMSVMGFANVHHLNIGTKAAAAIGRLATKWCKRNFKQPERTRHERWGEVNTYPMEALRVCFAEFYPNMTF